MKITAGWYSFRVTATTEDGELAVLNSWSKYAANDEQLKENRKEYLDYLVTLCYMKDPKVTHTIHDKKPSYDYFSM